MMSDHLWLERQKHTLVQGGNGALGNVIVVWLYSACAHIHNTIGIDKVTSNV